MRKVNYRQLSKAEKVLAALPRPVIFVNTLNLESVLTPVELLTFRLLAYGMGPIEQGRQRSISSKTVGTHIEHIKDKLGLASTKTVALAAALIFSSLHTHSAREAAP